MKNYKKIYSNNLKKHFLKTLMILFFSIFAGQVYGQVNGWQKLVGDNTETLLTFENSARNKLWGLNMGNNRTGLLFYEQSSSGDHLFLQPGGNTGIGTQYPNHKLDVMGVINSSSTIRAENGNIELKKGRWNDPSLLFNAGNTTGWSRIGAQGPLTFWANGKGATDDLPQFMLHSNGRVSIGNIDPQSKLDVSGTVNATGYLLNGEALSTGSSPWTTSGDNISFTDGNVGIGVTNPKHPLSIKTTSATKGILITRENANDSGGLYFTYGTNTDLVSGIQADRNMGGSSNGGLQIIAANTRPIQFYTKMNSSGTTLDKVAEAMRINGNGNVGIGVSNPGKKLDVNGETRIRGKIIYSNAAGATGEYIENLNIRHTTHGLGFYSENTLAFETKKTEFTTHVQDVTFNYGSATDLVKVSVNTWAKVNHAALTIGGATYIGPKAELAASAQHDKFKDEYLVNYNLWVEDGIVSEDLVLVDVDEWKDEVFKDDYKLMPLKEMEAFIKTNKHLPGVPSESTVKEKGYSVSEMNVIFLEKIEELVLHTISQEKKIDQLKEQLNKYDQLAAELEKLKALLK